MTATIATRRSEQGFTLVELAIVMIIIGLLIGGILKGQELIANARIASTVSQVKAIDAATTTFRDKYAAMPGDMSTASVRLPAACAGVACNDGSGNGRLDDVPFNVPAGEGIDFFQHLAAADLMGGISFDGSGGWGDIYPAASVDGGYFAGYYAGVTTDGNLGLSGTSPTGHYLTIVLDPTAVNEDTLTPNQGQRIDTKLDDGAPASGGVVGSGACPVAGNLYDEANQDKVCDLAIRFQN